MEERIKFWGVRGSIASPGPETNTVGGNTSCVEVSLGLQRIIIDAGTGLRALGAHRGGKPTKANLLFTHLHWDHIQGFPFFGPLYHPESEFQLIGPCGLEAALRDQMSRPTFPVGMEAMGATMTFRSVSPGVRFSIGLVQVATFALNHPGGAIGYRLSYGGKAVAYACDTEHRKEGLDPNLLELASGADLLVYDAQYLPEEYPSRVGWGHSTFEIGCELAQAAGVAQLILTHHEPTRSDTGVGEMEARARRLFANSWAAREGMEFGFDGEKSKLPIDPALEAYLASSLGSG